MSCRLHASLSRLIMMRMLCVASGEQYEANKGTKNWRGTSSQISVDHAARNIFITMTDTNNGSTYIFDALGMKTNAVRREVFAAARQHG